MQNGMFKKVVYMCAIDWQHEVGSVTCRVYPSLEAHQQDHKCWEACGVVELDVTDASCKYVVAQDLQRDAVSVLQSMKERWSERMDEILELAEIDPEPTSMLGKRIQYLRRVQEWEEKQYLDHLKVFTGASLPERPEPDSTK